MFIIRFFHFLIGYVIFKAEDGFPERFINLCARGGIPVWDIKCRGGVLFGKTSIKGYHAISEPAKKSGMNVSVCRSIGVPFFLRKYRRRAGLLAGLCVFAVFILFMSGTIWSIKVEGNSAVSESEIIDVMDKVGIKPGIKAKKINAAEAERFALELLPGLQWLAVNIEGSTVVIEVRERIAGEEREDYVHPHHIVAAQDGVIQILETYEGTEISKNGSAVAKGDLIISGITENKDSSVTFHHAKGYVAARVKTTLAAQAVRERDAQRLCGTKYRLTLIILNIKIPPRAAKAAAGAELYESTRWLYAGDKRLPVGYVMHRSLFYEDTSKKYTENEQRLIALRGLLTQTANEFRRSEILSQTSALEKTERGMKATGEFTALRNIGLERPFSVRETNEEEEE